MKFLLDGLAKKHLVMFSFDSNTEAIRRRPKCTCEVTESLAALMNKSSPRVGDNVKSPSRSERSAVICQATD